MAGNSYWPHLIAVNLSPTNTRNWSLPVITGAWKRIPRPRGEPAPCPYLILACKRTVKARPNFWPTEIERLKNVLFLIAKFITICYTAIKPDTSAYTNGGWGVWPCDLLWLMGMEKTCHKQKLDKGVLHFYILSSTLATTSHKNSSAKLLEGCERHRGELPFPLRVHPRPARPQASCQLTTDTRDYPVEIIWAPLRPAEHRPADLQLHEK